MTLETPPDLRGPPLSSTIEAATEPMAHNTASYRTRIGCNGEGPKAKTDGGGSPRLRRRREAKDFYTEASRNKTHEKGTTPLPECPSIQVCLLLLPWN